MNRHLCHVLCCLLFTLSLPVRAQENAVDVPLVNSTFEDKDNDKLPDGWKLSPPGNGDSTYIGVEPSGGVKIKDNDEGNGLGLAQWIDVSAGDQIIATADLQGSPNIWLTLIFVPSIPAKEGEINKVKVGEAKINLPAPAGTPAEVKATVPAGATKARVWLYCPKIGKCDVVVKSVSIKKIGGSGTPVSTTAPQPVKNVPDGTPNKERNDHGRDNPDSMIKPGVVAVVDFETGDFTQTRTLEGGKKEVVSAPEPVRSGKHAMKVMMTHDKYRSEMTGPRSAAYGEFKYGWSIYLPKEFDGNSWFSIITQWHSWGSGKDYTINPPGPPTCLVISKNKWDFLLRYQDGDTNNSTKKNFDMGSIESDLGKWADFVMEVNWQSPKSGGGYLRIWKNGTKVIDYEGPTWFDDKTSGPFFKMGIYKGSGTWKGEESGAIAYFDEFRMGDKSVLLDAVDPSKQPAPAALSAK